MDGDSEIHRKGAEVAGLLMFAASSSAIASVGSICPGNLDSSTGVSRVYLHFVGNGLESEECPATHQPGAALKSIGKIESTSGGCHLVSRKSVWSVC